MSTKYMNGTDRKESILAAAVAAAKQHGYNNFRLVHVAALAGCSTALVIIHYKTMTQIRRDVMRAAVRDEHLDIIATGIALKDPRCRKLAPELHARAIATL